jgi:polyketide synthase PksN
VGLHSVAFPAAAAHALGQQVIVAASDGVVRQRRVGSPAARRAGSAPRPAAPAPGQATPADGGPQADLATATILQCLSQALRMSVDTIDRGEPFSDYGLDSILGVRFVKNLNDRLGITLNAAILFDHTSVERLARHVRQTYGDRMRDMGVTARTAPVSSPPAPVPLPQTQVQALAAWSRPPQHAPGAPAERRQRATENSGRIAIIGMSGQCPGADNVERFWHNLIHGVDGVGELPSHYLNQEQPC